MPRTTDRHGGRESDLDRSFRSLSDEMQRRILVAILNENPSHEDEFVRIAFEPDGTARERNTVELHHSHLPHLDEAGFVDWEEETGRVTPGENFEEIRPLFELMVDNRELFPGDRP